MQLCNIRIFLEKGMNNYTNYWSSPDTSTKIIARLVTCIMFTILKMFLVLMNLLIKFLVSLFQIGSISSLWGEKLIVIIKYQFGENTIIRIYYIFFACIQIVNHLIFYCECIYGPVSSCNSCDASSIYRDTIGVT